jgi:hypothetical protein
VSDRLQAERRASVGDRALQRVVANVRAERSVRLGDVVVDSMAGDLARGPVPPFALMPVLGLGAERLF